jgi:hypothetical protein
MMMSVFGMILVELGMKIKASKVKPQTTLIEEEETTPQVETKEPERSPVEIAVRENIIKLVNLRATKVVKSKDRAEWVKKITDADMIEKFKVGQVTIDGKKKNVKKEIVMAIIEDMRGNHDT